MVNNTPGLYSACFISIFGKLMYKKESLIIQIQILFTRKACEE